MCACSSLYHHSSLWWVMMMSDDGYCCYHGGGGGGRRSSAGGWWWWWTGGGGGGIFSDCFNPRSQTIHKLMPKNLPKLTPTVNPTALFPSYALTLMMPLLLHLCLWLVSFNSCAESTSVQLWSWSHQVLIIPLRQRRWGGILVSLCPSVCPSVRPSVEQILSALYLPQY